MWLTLVVCYVDNRLCRVKPYGTTAAETSSQEWKSTGDTLDTITTPRRSRLTTVLRH